MTRLRARPSREQPEDPTALGGIGPMFVDHAPRQVVEATPDP